MEKKLLDNAIEHLKKDPNIQHLIEKYGTPEFSNIDDYFSALSKLVIYQQLSGKAARIIYIRYISLFDKKLPKPIEVLKIDQEVFRSIGVSQQKTNYILGLAKYFTKKKGNINFDKLSNNEVVKELIQLKGIGQWTIDMFLMFTLSRLDIMPVGDLGIQKAIKILYDMKEMPSIKDILQKSELWKPYRTVACWYLWRIVDDEFVW